MRRWYDVSNTWPILVFDAVFVLVLILLRC